jgi:type I restriction enzyme R subunit
MDKKSLSERDICTKFITPALVSAGWDVQGQLREEVTFTKGRIIVRGKMVKRGTPKRADYILEYKPNLRLAVIEAKDNNHSIGDGMQQGLDYGESLDVPFVYSSNGDGFLEHDRTRTSGHVEREISLDAFPAPEELWRRYTKAKGITESNEQIVTQDYYVDASGKAPHYFQEVAINRTIEAISKGQKRILLVMATGTGKTYTAFQIIWRLWKSRTKKRILFLADRNILVDQSRNNDFKPFGSAMTKIVNRTVNKSYEIYLSLYQAVTGTEAKDDIYKQFSRDFFDLIIIDECHRGSAADDAAWREILDYFTTATQIGLTATPKETKYVSNIDYFGPPVYTYSLKQGIDDGFLAPYKVIRIDLDKDVEGWRPERGKLDENGQPIDDRIYNQKDFDRTLVLGKRTQLVAKRVSDFLKATNRFDKSIVFCEDIDHAERMRQALVNENADLAADNPRYLMRITGDNQEGKDELDNFILPESRYPVIATTSKLMTTGVDAQTCKLIVIDQNIESLSMFKQIIGRGTRVREEYGKLFFTIMDFRKATELFADPEFDGDPVQIYIHHEGDPPVPPDDEPPDHPPIGEDPGGNVILVDPPPGKRVKYIVNDVPVTVVAERVQYYDKDGKLITESLKDYTRKNLLKEYASLDNFLTVWGKAEQKRAILRELEERGVFLDALAEEVGKDFDAFDLVCHVAFGQPPLTRRERADNVRKRNYFAKYGEKARAVLDALLSKYADEGIQNIEDMEVLKVQPLNKLGTPVELIQSFGGRQQFIEAVRGLEAVLYAAA